MILGLIQIKFLLLLFRGVSCFDGANQRRVFKPGDFIIGGLFPINSQNICNTTGTRTMCDLKSLDLESLLSSEVMIYAIEQINNSSLLSGAVIGYEMYDSCSCVSMALHGALELMEEQTDAEQQCVAPGDSGVRNKVKAVIGERSSEVSVAVARLLALPLMTQISYASTSELLSSRSKFPSFFRTVPSDKHQTNAIAELVKRFNFVPVGIIGSEDEYGKYGAESLSDYFKIYNICVEFKEILPDNFSENRSEFIKLQRKLSSWRSEAIVLFTNPTNAKIIMQEVISADKSRTWIASDAWSTSQEILNLENLPDSASILGITCKSPDVPGFSEYMSNLQITNTSFLYNLLSESSFRSEQTDDQNCSSLTLNNQNCINKTSLINFINNTSYEAYSVYMAVNIIAHGLKNISNYSQADFPSRTLTEAIKRLNFTLDNKSYISLNEYGEVDIGYNILKWETDRRRRIRRIGTFEENHLNLYPGETGEENNVTQFNCSKSCKAGQELISPPENPCCKTCRNCKSNFFSTDGMKCELCGDSNSTLCPGAAPQFLPWSSGFSIALGVFASVGLVLTLITMVLFWLNIHTPIVKAAGGMMCLPALVSLLGCFSSVFLFLGEPAEFTCKAALPLFSLSFTVCVSCIIANFLQIFVGFAFTLKLGYWLKRINQPVVLVMASAGGQVFICALWLALGPPYKNRSDDEQVVECEDGSLALFVIAQIYIALLCIICFIFAYKGRRLPGLYKNARFVTIGMLIYLVVWIIFIPIYTQEHGIHERAVKASAILLSGYSILTCHFAPKGFILVWKKELNDENVIVQQIRKHYEKKGIAVLS
uniref:G-protein coupled receptor family C group 6 member A n=2 Tax=Astyanax mexicanus TaxID=7994 RepID=W5L1F0_ASTMX